MCLVPEIHARDLWGPETGQCGLGPKQLWWKGCAGFNHLLFFFAQSWLSDEPAVDQKVRVGDVHESLLPLVKQRKLTRIEGYNELRGLSHSLSLIGLTLMDFAVQEGLILRPLLKQELLLPQPNGRPLVHNTVTQLTYPMVPPALQLSQLPLLVSISDQGPVNVPALNYLMYSEESLLVTSQWDCYHRTWNDLKLAGKRAAGGV